MEISIDMSNGDVWVGRCLLKQGMSSAEIAAAGLVPVRETRHHLGHGSHYYGPASWSGEMFHLSASFRDDRLLHLSLINADADPYDAQAARQFHDMRLRRILGRAPDRTEPYRSLYQWEWGEIYSWPDLKGGGGSIFIAWHAGDGAPGSQS